MKELICKIVLHLHLNQIEKTKEEGYDSESTLGTSSVKKSKLRKNNVIYLDEDRFWRLTEK